MEASFNSKYTDPTLIKKVTDADALKSEVTAIRRERADISSIDQQLSREDAGSKQELESLRAESEAEYRRVFE